MSSPLSLEESTETHMWHLHSLAWNGKLAKQNSSVIQEHIPLLLNSSQGVIAAPRALRGRAAPKHDFWGRETSVGGMKPLKLHTARVMPIGSSCRILLQPCGFGRKAVTLTLSALHPHTLPPPTSTQGRFHLHPLQRELPTHGNYIPKRHETLSQEAWSKTASGNRAREPLRASLLLAFPVHFSTLLAQASDLPHILFLSQPPARVQSCPQHLALLLHTGHVGTGSGEAAASVATAPCELLNYLVASK